MQDEAGHGTALASNVARRSVGDAPLRALQQAMFGGVQGERARAQGELTLTVMRTRVLESSRDFSGLC